MHRVFDRAGSKVTRIDRHNRWLFEDLSGYAWQKRWSGVLSGRTTAVVSAERIERNRVSRDGHDYRTP